MTTTTVTTTGTATGKRGRPRSEAIDAAILDAAVAEMIEVGFFAMSMESIANRAGVAKTTVYRRFPDSTELGLDALRRLKGPASTPPPGDAREQILWLAQRARRTWANPTYSAAMRRILAEGATHPDIYRVCQERLVGLHLRQMNAALARARDEGLIRADADVDWVRRLIVGPTLAAAFTLRKIPTADEITRTVDTVLRGLAP